MHSQRRILKEGAMYRAVIAATLTVLFVVVGFALVVPMASAQDCGFSGQPPCPCGTGNDPVPCPACGGEGQPQCALCHNIGGPRDLGANCDGTGNCSFRVGGVTIN